MLDDVFNQTGVRSQAAPAFADLSLGGAACRRLPAGAFESLAFHKLEDAAIWTRAQVGLGFAAEIAEPGDVLPFSVGNHGIHVERMGDGSLVGRFNKAQHGGCRTVPQQCQTGARTRCSFTACGYSHDRRPIAAADPDRARQLDQYLGLRPERLLRVDIHRWGPLLTARLDPHRALALDWPQPSTRLAARQDRAGETIWQEFAANWKHLAMALAGDSEAVASLLFPNVIVREDEACACFVILQPVGLARTLCRIRALGQVGADVPSWVMAGGRRAELAQLGRRAASPIGDDVFRSAFEHRVATAVAGLAEERRTDVLFRAGDDGEW